MGGKLDLDTAGEAVRGRRGIEDLFRRYHGRVRGFFRHRGCTDDEAQDLVQATFLRAASGGGPHRRTSRDAWLFVIASNVWNSHLRRRKAGKRDGVEVVLQDLHDGDQALLARRAPPADPLDDLLRAERKRHLARALAALPPQRRAFLELYTYQGRKYREIAAMFGVSVNTVKSQIFEARETLRQELAEVFGDDPFWSRDDEP